MPYPMPFCAVIDLYIIIICHVIQWEYRNNAGSKVKFCDSKGRTAKPDAALCIGKVGHYYDVVSKSVVEFVDKQRNDYETMIFSIKLFGKDDNDVKLFKELTTIVPHDWNSNLSQTQNVIISLKNVSYCKYCVVESTIIRHK